MRINRDRAKRDPSYVYFEEIRIIPIFLKFNIFFCNGKRSNKACVGGVWGACEGACLVCGGVVWVVGRRVLGRSWGESIARRFIIRIPW